MIAIDMAMPRSCTECPLYIKLYLCDCYRQSDGRPPACPIHEVWTAKANDIVIRGTPSGMAEHHITDAIVTLLERNGAIRYEETALDIGPAELAEAHTRLEGTLTVVMPK